MTRRDARRSRPWAIHLCWIGLVLLGATAFVGFDAFVYVDEAALYAQVEVVEDGPWTVPRPLGAADDAQRWAPMDNSRVVGDEFAPFPNHPLHVMVAAAVDRLGGSVGIRLLSTVGVLCAAATAGMLASLTGRREAIAALVIAALASPLLFDAQLVVAHALAAPLAGLLTLLVIFRPPPGPRLSRVLLVAALAATGSLLRSEFVVFALAIAVTAIVTSSPDRRRGTVALSVASIGGAVSAYVLEPVWITELVGEGTAPKVISTASRGGPSDRLDSVSTVLVGTGSGRAVTLVLAVVLAGVAVAVARWRPTAMPVASASAVVAAVLAIVHLRTPTVVPGILWAFPLLVLATVCVRRGQLTPRMSRALTGVGVFAGVVLALQYRSGGSFEWGWRYVHIALPVVSAALARPVVAFFDSARGLDGRVVVAGATVVSLLVPISGVLQQRRHVDATRQLIESVDEAMDESHAELIVSTDRLLGRYLWRQSIDGRVVTTDRGDASGLLIAAEDAGYERILLVWVGDEPDMELAGYTMAQELDLVAPFEATVLQR